MYLSQKKANNKYIKNNIKSYSLKLNKNTDKELISYLDKKEKYSVYIKNLLLKEMKEGNKMKKYAVETNSYIIKNHEITDELELLCNNYDYFNTLTEAIECLDKKVLHDEEDVYLLHRIEYKDEYNNETEQIGRKDRNGYYLIIDNYEIERKSTK